MAKFDSMHFENSKGHALASLTSAEKYLEDGDLEGARIAFNCARPYIKIMENEANNEGAPKSKDGEWKELQNRLASLCDKYHEMKDEATENDEDETTENEEVEEEKNVDVLKLNEVVATTIETIREFNKDFSVDDVEEMNRAIVLIKGLKEAVDSDLTSILEKLEDARKDEEIIAKVEAIREAIPHEERAWIESRAIVGLREFKEIVEKGSDETVMLSTPAIFAAIHQTSDSVEIFDEEVFYIRTTYSTGKFGINVSLTYKIEFDENFYFYLELYLGVIRIARITTKGCTDDDFRNLSALGCEYAIAFRNIAKNI